MSTKQVARWFSRTSSYYMHTQLVSLVNWHWDKINFQRFIKIRYISLANFSSFSLILPYNFFVVKKDTCYTTQSNFETFELKRQNKTNEILFLLNITVISLYSELGSPFLKNEDCCNNSLTFCLESAITLLICLPQKVYQNRQETTWQVFARQVV